MPLFNERISGMGLLMWLWLFIFILLLGILKEWKEGDLEWKFWAYYIFFCKENSKSLIVKIQISNLGKKALGLAYKKPFTVNEKNWPKEI